MKIKTISILCILCMCLVILSACSTGTKVNLQELELNVLETNMRDETLITAYTSTMKNAQEFEPLLIEAIFSPPETEIDFENLEYTILDSLDIYCFSLRSTIQNNIMLLYNQEASRELEFGELLDTTKIDSVKVEEVKGVYKDATEIYYFFNEETSVVTQYLLFANTPDDMRLVCEVKWLNGILYEFKFESKGVE